MKINVGTKAEIKINAVKEVIQDYIFLKDAEVIGVEVSTQVSGQPKSLKETIEGAMNRAKNSFRNCDYSFGIESGLLEVPFSKSGFMDICACVIFDGEKIHLGLSPAFEFPKEMMNLMIKNGLNASEAALKTKLTQNNYVGHAEGTIGILTKGRINRKDQIKPAIVTALIHLENPELY
ncbi:MAG: inosine/xanthosine triphosphatase [Nanoarchaeota archaeon]